MESSKLLPNLKIGWACEWEVSLWWLIRRRFESAYLHKNVEVFNICTSYYNICDWTIVGLCLRYLKQDEFDVIMYFEQGDPLADWRVINCGFFITMK